MKTDFKKIAEDFNKRAEFILNYKGDMAFGGELSTKLFSLMEDIGITQDLSKDGKYTEQYRTTPLYEVVKMFVASQVQNNLIENIKKAASCLIDMEDSNENQRH